MNDRGQDIAVVLGTRPEIIKLAPVIKELGDRAWVIHTGQHYDGELAGQHFAELGLDEPDVRLTGVGGSGRGKQIARMLSALTEIFVERRPAAVIVQGDTNTVSAGAQAANYLDIPVIHVEAGLRSNDRGMPEEINRLVTSALADVHCAPTELNADALLDQGVTPEAVFHTGNTVVEATLAAVERGSEDIASWFPDGILPDRYVLATIHRPENTDTEPALRRILEGLRHVDAPVLFLAHPRTRNAIERFGLTDLLWGLIVRGAPASAEFLALARNASLLISDSGGVQEECTIIRVPLAVVRRSTERPEAVEAGFARLVPPHLDLAHEANAMLADERLRETVHHAPSPFGDGHASSRIAQVAFALADGASPSAAVRSAADARVARRAA
ncbi:MULTISPECIES: non-hydrolyzing UDP-N-acetylglucosamine 2-epimerase [unclassified Microbacterium]|uniref:non-hydrolyzing UDP-N-acetylglucosamine 2-epimerase n=1 Tax=unclassified Microbacterium TaxID=2609290 RepID=UPI000EA8F4E2|nr:MULTISPECIES: UDP-N-acetylglucosamine 2-epimerase (non-hydrolyzing) [unclassified Microbacterium]MBT2483980.1 UDP-N-acetylglucosamine 2-epimerase (non-hydrolyzing) [Microbacterium sp. ISL-108]RKN66945.1 UDP-N-acetylglucosamine 2-epimerase (non-hydrolyzing) [Microbacterium sp. CGR2]